MTTATDLSVIDWKTAHDALVNIARKRGELDREEALCLLEAFRCGAHRHFGFATFSEYLDRHLGYGPHLAAERLRVAQALEQLPEIARALSQGELVWCAVRELTRVATAETEKAWLGAARGCTVREVERRVAGHRRGDRPEDPSDPAAKRHALKLVLPPEAMALYRDAVAKVRKDTAGPIEEEEAFAMIMRGFLGGPTEEGRSSYQVVVSTCPSCKRGWQEGRGELFELSAETLEMATCDAQVIPLERPPAAKRAEHDSASAQLDERLDAHREHESARAEQEVPPRIRRLVIRRDHGRCTVPGCRNAVFLDVHHIKFRSEGGDHDPDQITTLCFGHHAALHRGFLIIEGRPSTGLRFYHADGTTYGGGASPRAIETSCDAYAALRALGFGHTESQRAIADARSHVGADATSEDVVRAALRILRE